MITTELGENYGYPGYHETDIFDEFTENHRTPYWVARDLGFHDEDDLYEFFRWKIFPKGKKRFNFLDIGCGADGYAVREYREVFNFAEVFGIDRASSDRGLVLRADFDNMADTVGDGMMDSGIAICSLGWYAQSKEQLECHFEQLWRLMAPGSRLLFSLDPCEALGGHSRIRIPSSFGYKKGLWGNTKISCSSFGFNILGHLKKKGFNTSLEWELSWLCGYPTTVPAIIEKPC